MNSILRYFCVPSRIGNVNSIKSNYRPRRYSSAATDSKNEEPVYSLAVEDDETTLIDEEQELQRKRNKSRLTAAHRNIIHGKVPYSEPVDECHLTLLYKRRIFGRYGYQTNINPGSLWPNEEDIKKTLEYENIAYPYTIKEAIARQKEKLNEEHRQIQERQQKIVNNIKKLDQWKMDIENRAAKKLADLAKAKAKKDALIEEVRRHFGYKIDPNDARFQEMLVIKERAQKKKLKEERAKERQERLLVELAKNE